MRWDLPARVKRLSLSSYLYTEIDLAHFDILVAEQDSRVVGVAALEDADPSDCPPQQAGLLLHGLYVEPDWQGRGIGQQLLQAAGQVVHDAGRQGLLVKAHKDAVGFFTSQGLRRLEVEDKNRDYANRFWLDVSH